ncbi:MAG: twitching motility protein PilT [Proteobacteria bacterium SW_6_67_9]|nr:MAG: twitching motility protein PilT [Proteobacteria bacterium SW_6_67_9]
MAHVTFRFYEELNDFLALARRKRAFTEHFARRTSVKDMIEALGVPHPEVELIVANGASVGFDYIVRDGDRIAVYPVFEALDVRSALRVRNQPLRSVRFAADANLGALARNLRFCGFDTCYRNDVGDDELVQLAADEGRIVITRDRDLLKRRLVDHGYFVRAVEASEQLAEVFRRFDLYELAEPFTRCGRCNGRLRDVAKARIIERLEPLTRQHFDTFRQCEGCQRVYWRGSHVTGIERLITRLREGGA